MTYTRPYPGGFVTDSSALAASDSLQTSTSLQTDSATPLTAAALNSMELGAVRAANGFYTASGAAELPPTPFDGQLVYRADLGWLEVYRGSEWYPIHPPGAIAQFGVKRTDAQVTYSSLTSGNGTTISELALTVTPRYGDSTIILEYMINCEYDEDWQNVLLMHRDGALITSHPPGYNYEAGNQRWSGLSIGGSYDENNDSTPNHVKLMFITPASGTATRTYAPATRDTTANGSTMYLNRTLTAGSGNFYERMVSYAMFMEVLG